MRAQSSKQAQEPASQTKALTESLSGHEAHHAWTRCADGRFVDAARSLGIAHRSDGRSFVAWDADGDGDQDLAVMHTNAPTLAFWENQSVEQSPWIAVRLIGEHQQAWNASVFVTQEGGFKSHKQSMRNAAGFASQPSAALHFALPHPKPVYAHVVWPSGKQQSFGPLQGHQVWRLHENRPKAKPIVRPFAHRPINKAQTKNRSLNTIPQWPQLTAKLATQNIQSQAIRIVLATAPWCQACKNEIPALRDLQHAWVRRHQYPLPMLAIPADTPSQANDLAMFNFVQRDKPPYVVLQDASAELRNILQNKIKHSLRMAVLPAFLVLNDQGEIVWVGRETPTLSFLEQIKISLQQ